MVLIIILMAMLIAAAYLLGQAIGGWRTSKYASTEQETDSQRKYMKAFWVFPPIKASFIVFGIYFLAFITMFFFSLSIYSNDKIKSYDNGEIVKVTEYKMVKKPGCEPQIDSTFRFERK